MTTAHYNPFEILEKRLDSIQDLIIALRKREQPELTQQPAEEKFIDSKKVEELYGVSSVTVWDWERKGILKPYRIGRLKRFKMSEVLSAPALIQRTSKHTQSN